MGDLETEIEKAPDAELDSNDVNLVIEHLRESKEIDFTVTDYKGLHWKPSSSIAESVTRSNCAATLTVTKDDREYVANADSVIEILQLPVKEGDVVTIKIIGDDSKKLITQLLSLVHWYPTQHKEVWGQ